MNEWKERMKSIDGECKKRKLYPYSKVLIENEDWKRQYHLMYAGFIGTLILMFGMAIAFVAITNYSNKIPSSALTATNDSLVCDGNDCLEDKIFITSTLSNTYLECSCNSKKIIGGGI